MIAENKEIIDNEDQHIGQLDDDGNDIEEFLDDSDEDENEEGENNMELGGGGPEPETANGGGGNGGTRRKTITFPKPADYVAMTLQGPPLTFPNLNKIEQSRLVLDICIGVLNRRKAKVVEMKQAAAGGNATPINEKTTLIYDGDQYQMAAAMNYVVENHITGEDKTDSIKPAGGCTGCEQPNDLTRCHHILHEYGKNRKGVELPDPTHLPFVMKTLVRRGMKGGSLNSYKNYFKTEVAMQADAFRPTVVVPGYIRAGFKQINNNGVPQVVVCRDTILQSCSTYNALSAENKARVHNGMDVLQENVDVSFETDEKHMQSLLGDIMNTKIDPNKVIPFNQKRAVCLNKQPVIDARRALMESKRAEDEALKRAKEVKAQRKKLKEDATTQLNAGTLDNIQGPPKADLACMNPMCGNSFSRQESQSSSVHKWMGCPMPGCDKWCCHLVACSKMMPGHRKICESKRLQSR